MNLNGVIMRVGDFVSDILLRDFIYEMYEVLIEKTTGCAHSTLPVRGYISAESLPNRFAAFRHDIDTVCMHGNPLTPHDNRDIRTYDELVCVTGKDTVTNVGKRALRVFR